ncbi:MAG TPA: chemotaxis protein CheB [Candidatus Contendobacter sp.]|nr:chemotaxis protein CheB [Candidatus Contendobacter sp.]
MRKTAKDSNPKPDPVAPAPSETLPPAPPQAFPIIGIGASAGGLEALEQFLRHVSADSGMAFVIVQHLDPTHRGIMPELLQRATGMVVEQVKDHMAVQPNCVYVIPPNKDLSLLRGTLHLFEPATPRGLRLPIDFFFRSLAEDQRERSVGVILSGMGSDGTLGLRAIKEIAGLALVQEPTSAKFDGMPRSAIDAGLADIVAPPEELYQRLVAYFGHAPSIAQPPAALNDKDQSGLDKIVILLRTHTGHDFSLYKKNTLYRRIERRMGLHQIDRIAHYVRYLQENAQERDLLFKELLIGVTSFFRDPAAWAELREQILPALLASRPDGGQLRAWAAGCSTGEEAYSLGIAFKEALVELSPIRPFSLQIFATDLDRDAIDKARQGVYPENIAADVSPERLRRFFIQEERGYRIGKEIREMVTLATQNLIMDPPFTKLDLLICRNLLIYLTSDLQKKLLPLFHYSLNPGGVLFLGSAETVGSASGLFVPLEGKGRFYQRKESATRVEPVEFPATFLPPLNRHPAAVSAIESEASLQTLVDDILLREFCPAAVLTNEQGNILYIKGRTGQYLEPAAGQVNWNLYAMARDGLRDELPGLCQRAILQTPPQAITRRGLRIRTNGDYRIVDLTVRALREPAALYGKLLVIFADVPTPPTVKRRGKAVKPDVSADSAHLEEEAQQLRETLQTTREEMQTSQEELKSANEELQSTNEELQSTNEELTTSKEEMQSLNEELQTVNAELQAKVEELSRANNDMKNLLNSTDIATLFLDGALHVRRFTTPAARLIKLIPGDVGRPITDIASDLLYPTLTEDVTEVLQTLAFKEKPVTTRDGRWFTARIMPYRTLDNRIDGVVMTFFDITTQKLLEGELRQARDELEAQLANKTQEQEVTQAALQAERARPRPEVGPDQPGGGAP